VSRKSRLVVILLLIAAAGIAGLMLVAKQYQRAVTTKATDDAVK
jgi:uncharacterized membrane protein